MVAKEFTVIRSPKTLYEKVQKRHILYGKPFSMKTYPDGTIVKKYDKFSMISTPEISSSTRRYNPLELVNKSVNPAEYFDKMRDIIQETADRISEVIVAKENLMYKQFIARLQEMGIHFDETNKESYKDFRLEYHRNKIKVFKENLFIIEFDRIRYQKD